MRKYSKIIGGEAYLIATNSTPLCKLLSRFGCRAITGCVMDDERKSHMLETPTIILL
jgi:hypothetical protein